jgi:biopolymer transport protein ExbD
MSDINVTPLVDVMLVLVVIFIITAPLLASSLRLDLPKAEGTQPGRRAPLRHVVVDAKGGLFLDDKPVTRSSSRRAWPRPRAAQNPTPRSSCAPTRPCPTAGRGGDGRRPEGGAAAHRLRGRAGSR